MISVRSVQEEDQPVWRDLWRAYLAYYGADLSEDIYATTFARLTAPDFPDCNGLVAWDGDRAVGLAHYIFHRHGWQIADICYLQDLYVAPQSRGAGVGRALIEAVYAAADAADRAQVYWLTESSNETARRLYDRIGTATPFIKYRR